MNLSVKPNLLVYIAAAFAMILVDYVWLSLATPMYNMLVKSVQGANLRVRKLPAAFSYLSLLLAMFIFVIPAIARELGSKRGTGVDHHTKLLRLCALYGGLLGFIIYSVFNFTNLAIFKDYLWFPAMVDSVWGGILFTIIPYFAFSLFA